jgi:hypothetical protein
VISIDVGAGSQESAGKRTVRECSGSGRRYGCNMANRPDDPRSVPAVVVIYPDEDYSPEAFHAFLVDLLAGPEPELESLDAADGLRELRVGPERP